MAKKLIICAHGIGDHDEDFYKKWETILKQNHDESKFKVVGLHWDKLLDKARNKYLNPNEEIVNKVIDKIKHDHVNLNDKILHFLKEYISDVVIYLFADELLRAEIWPECLARLDDLIYSDDNRDYEPVLLGHSLGTIMLMHISWWKYYQKTTLAYFDFILTGSPIGVEWDRINDSFLAQLREIGGQPSNNKALEHWANTWYHTRNRLHIIINEYDPIAWDVKIGGIDIIPLKQGLSQQQINLIEDVNPDTVITMTAGTLSLTELINNHDISNYLNSEVFKNIFDDILDR